MAASLSLYRISNEIVSFYLETEALHSYLRRIVYDASCDGKVSEPADVLDQIHWANRQSRDVMQIAHDDAMWLFRRAHAHVSPGKLIRDHFPSYHDLALWESEYFLSALQLSNQANDQKPGETIIPDAWPLVLNLDGVSKALTDHSAAFDDLEAIQGYLKMEAATAANICPESVEEKQAGGAGKASDNLTQRERDAIEALGSGTMQAQPLSDAAGYHNNSNFRSMLSNLVKRGYLKTSSAGYTCTDKCHDTSQ